MLLHEVPEIKESLAEAVHKRFEDECQIGSNASLIADHHYETYLFALTQLPGPDNTTGPGFQDTAEWLLGDRISPKASAILQNSGWSLHRLLTATNDDLLEIGIAFQNDRVKILAAIRAFHSAPWKTLQTISLKPEGNSKIHKEPIVFLLETFSRLTQQLYIDAATIAWLRQRIPTKASDRERLIAPVKEAIDASNILIKMSKEIHNNTKHFTRNLPHHPVDYIGPQEKKSRPMYERILASSVFLVSITLLSPVIEDKISHTVLSPLCRLPIKWCVFLVWMCV